ncbi:MAG: hypothetical protein JXA07_08000 [Spirochaetes bacterium]|nr:hypothetical protein [Spirochaetota bacterium]
MKEQFDSKTSYCRSLGHHVPFRYCRTVNNGLPCRKIRDCWYEKIDIDGFIAQFYTESEHKQIFAPPAEKISSLIDLIRKARDNK